MKFCSYEENVSAEGNTVNDVLAGNFPLLESEVEVDDVNTIASAVDVRKHLWIPTLGLVTIVSACIHEALNCYWGAWLDIRRRSCSDIFRTHFILYVLV